MTNPETAPRGHDRYRPPERFHVFVSYTTREEEVRAVKPMADHFLRRVLRPAIERSLGEPPAFYDGYSLHRPGAPFSDAELRMAIRFAIEESEVLVALVSPAYPGSRWCRYECETMAAKELRPWFDVCRAAPIAELRDRRPLELRPGVWACMRATLLRWWLRRKKVPAQPGGVIVPVIWKGDAGSLAELPGLERCRRAFDWTACGAAFNARWRIGEHLFRHGSVSPSWEWEADALNARCEKSMRATAAAIVRILRERRSEYAADAMSPRRDTDRVPLVPRLAIRPLLPPPWPAIQPLIDESRREGFRFLVRLRTEFESGANRFDAPGEALLGAWTDAGLAGIGGLNRDPYASEPGVGRLRHLYVGQAFRGHSVGRALVEALVSAARPHFQVLRLRTDTPAAARFYEALGFVPVDSPPATHQLEIGSPAPPG